MIFIDGDTESARTRKIAQNYSDASLVVVVNTQTAVFLRGLGFNSIVGTGADELCVDRLDSHDNMSY